MFWIGRAFDFGVTGAPSASPLFADYLKGSAEPSQLGNCKI